MSITFMQPVFFFGMAIVFIMEPVSLHAERLEEGHHFPTPAESPFNESESSHDEIDLELEKLKELWLLTLSSETIVLPVILHQDYCLETQNLLETQHFATPDISRGPPLTALAA